MSTIAPRTLRDDAMRRYEAAETRFKGAAARALPLSFHEATALSEDKKQALRAYYDALPTIAVSRCPHCGSVLSRRLDPWGLDGYWWQDKLRRETAEPPACDHFRVLTGAVNLGQIPPSGGTEEAFPGPEVPYVVPRVLALPTMEAVVASFELGSGYRAFPIAYFSVEVPRPGTLTQSWARRSYGFRDSKGNPAFTYDTSPWDFDLRPWIEKRRLAWINPGDTALALLREPAASCPYLALPGRRQPLAIRDKSVRELSLPDGHRVDPFNE